QSPLHLQNGFRLDTEVTGHSVDFVVVHPAQAFLGTAQVEEQFALRLGGRHLDDTPVTQDVFVYFSTNPVYGEGNQANAHIGVEALDRFHQADIAFLNQIGQWQTIAGISTGNVDDEA